ncbi:hypothetical protein [Diaphorobacter sp.]|uniref:hypothetical protein n=1 Tax=Diaphorobacter sp. TaxID=1934310 RepID=UPI00258F963C|nr:hypothetical protein [Diaphorobacter sp.]
MNNEPNTKAPDINPATGLPLIDDTYIDVGGSPYGEDIYQPTWSPLPTYEPNWPSGDVAPW